MWHILFLQNLQVSRPHNKWYKCIHLVIQVDEKLKMLPISISLQRGCSTNWKLFELFGLRRWQFVLICFEMRLSKSHKNYCQLPNTSRNFEDSMSLNHIQEVCRLNVACLQTLQFNWTYWVLVLWQATNDNAKWSVWRCLSYSEWRFSTMLVYQRVIIPQRHTLWGFSRGVTFKELKSVSKTLSIPSTSRLESFLAFHRAVFFRYDISGVWASAKRVQTVCSLGCEGSSSCLTYEHLV